MSTNSCQRKGFCRDCWKPLPPDEERLRCLECRTKGLAASKKYRADRKSEGVCLGCGSPDIITKGEELSCAVCYLKRTALKHLGSRTRWIELRNLWDKQGGRCPYLNTILELGVDASVDHILPKSRYPELKHSINNLEWVDRRVNYMKNDMTKDEFLAFIKQIKTNC